MSTKQVKGDSLRHRVSRSHPRHKGTALRLGENVTHEGTISQRTTQSHIATYARARQVDLARVEYPMRPDFLSDSWRPPEGGTGRIARVTSRRSAWMMPLIGGQRWTTKGGSPRRLSPGASRIPCRDTTSRTRSARKGHHPRRLVSPGADVPSLTSFGAGFDAPRVHRHPADHVMAAATATKSWNSQPLQHGKICNSLQ